MPSYIISFLNPSETLTFSLTWYMKFYLALRSLKVMTLIWGLKAIAKHTEFLKFWIPSLTSLFALIVQFIQEWCVTVNPTLEVLNKWTLCWVIQSFKDLKDFLVLLYHLWFTFSISVQVNCELLISIVKLIEIDARQLYYLR